MNERTYELNECVKERESVWIQHKPVFRLKCWTQKKKKISKGNKEMVATIWFSVVVVIIQYACLSVPVSVPLCLCVLCCLSFCLFDCLNNNLAFKS